MKTWTKVRWDVFLVAHVYNDNVNSNPAAMNQR